MAWIRDIPEDEAEGDLARRYAPMLDPETGRVDNILRINGLHPAGLSAHFGLYTAVMGGTPGLDRTDRELIAFVVSRLNACHY